MVRGTHMLNVITWKMEIEASPLEQRVKILEEYVDYLYIKLVELENLCGVEGQQPPVRVPDEKEVIECDLYVSDDTFRTKKKAKLNRSNAMFINE